MFSQIRTFAEAARGNFLDTARDGLDTVRRAFSPGKRLITSQPDDPPAKRQRTATTEPGPSILRPRNYNPVTQPHLRASAGADTSTMPDAYPRPNSFPRANRCAPPRNPSDACNGNENDFNTGPDNHGIEAIRASELPPDMPSSSQQPSSSLTPSSFPRHDPVAGPRPPPYTSSANRFSPLVARPVAISTHGAGHASSSFAPTGDTGSVAAGLVPSRPRPRSRSHRRAPPTKSALFQSPSASYMQLAAVGTPPRAHRQSLPNSRPITALDASARKQSSSRYNAQRRLSFGGPRPSSTPAPSSSPFAAAADGANTNTPAAAPAASAAAASAAPAASAAAASAAPAASSAAASASPAGSGRHILQQHPGQSRSSVGGGPSENPSGDQRDRPASLQALHYSEMRRQNSRHAHSLLEEQRKIREESLALDKHVRRLEQSAAPPRPIAPPLFRPSVAPKPGGAGGVKIDSHDLSFYTASAGKSRSELRGMSTPDIEIVRTNLQGSASHRARDKLRASRNKPNLAMLDTPVFMAKMARSRKVRHQESDAEFAARQAARDKLLAERERSLLDIRAQSTLYKRQLDHEIDVDQHVYNIQKAKLEAAGTVIDNDGVDEPAGNEMYNFDYELDLHPDWDEQNDAEATAEKEMGVTVVKERSSFAMLTDSALKRLRKTMSERQQRVVSEICNIPIRVSDIQLLRPNCWLNDEVINGYMELLKQRSMRHEEELFQAEAKGVPLNKRWPRVQILTSFFYAKLFENDPKTSRLTYDYSRVRRWTRRFDVFSYDLMFVPVNHGNLHWTLSVVNFRDKRIEYYDSMGSCHHQVTDNMMRWLKDEMEHKKQQVLDPSEWSTVLHGRDVPQQSNSDDCGMFMCKFTDFLSREADLNFSAAHMNYFRARMAHELIMKRAA
jgi:sentrin-specific protease 1